MELHTPRLVIRDYRPTDWQDLLEIFSDEAVMKDCEPAYDEARTKSALACFMEKSIAYAVVLRKTGKVIGHALFHQLPGEEAGVYELGWFFNRAYWRKGYAYEASRALMDYGFEELGLHKLCAETIDPIRSAGLMEKLGMRHEGTFRAHAKAPTGRWADVYWYGICNPKEETI